MAKYQNINLLYWRPILNNKFETENGEMTGPCHRTFCFFHHFLDTNFSHSLYFTRSNIHLHKDNNHLSFLSPTPKINDKWKQYSLLQSQQISLGTSFSWLDHVTVVYTNWQVWFPVPQAFHGWLERWLSIAATATQFKNWQLECPGEGWEDVALGTSVGKHVRSEIWVKVYFLGACQLG